MNFMVGLLGGIILGAAIGIVMADYGHTNKEMDAYEKGYADGMANANKNKEV